MDYTIKLSNAINEMGNALTAAEWPVKAVKVGDRVKLYDTKQIYKDLTFAGIEVDNASSDFHDCVNELCLKCGQYKYEHAGACEGCRWLKHRRGW